MTHPQHAAHETAHLPSSATPEQHTVGLHIKRIRQDDFLAQLSDALAAYDTDGDGLLSEADWLRVAQNMPQTA